MNSITVPVVLTNGDDLVLAHEHWSEYEDASTPEVFGLERAHSVAGNEAAEGFSWILIARPPDHLGVATSLTEADFAAWEDERAVALAEIRADEALTRDAARYQESLDNISAAQRARAALEAVGIDPADLRALLFEVGQ